MTIRKPTCARAVLAMACALALAACGGGGGGGGGAPTGADFVVTDTAGRIVAGATVYLVPASAVDGTPFDGSDVNDGSAGDRDEPLEDAVRLHGATFPQAVTGADGRASLPAVPAGRYFHFVQPGAADAEHLPGGEGCRVSRDTSAFLGTTVPVSLSSRPGPGATYRGTSTCLVCHPAYAAIATHPHRLGFSVPGSFAPLQDPSRYPLFQGNWARFLPAATFLGGTPVYCTDYDPTRGFDKFKTSLALPAGQTLYVVVWLWRDLADGKYKVTLQNAINPADPRSPLTLTVELTYGGSVWKQRNLVRVQGRRGLYPFFQFQPEGSDARFDRTRKVYRDYHLDWWWDAPMQTLKDPPASGTWDGSCTGCHATGFSRFQDPVTQEWLFDAVDDIAGEYDIDGNGNKDEINIGCEVCHGPGSEHAAWAADPANAGREARYIVAPEKLSPERGMLVCGRCHDRPRGNGPVPNDEPLDPQGRFPAPGIGRAEYLATFTSRKGPAAADYWVDDLHSKSHHQQYADLLKSTMHRNDRILTVCSDCHGSHGDGAFIHHLKEDPFDPNTSLCQQCHAVDILAHMLDKTGSTHGGNSTLCIRCHMPQVAKTGSGRYGILLGIPTGASSDNDITYFENDVTSHLFKVPSKSHPAVAGVVPASAMPVPYTNSCGAPCHDASNLRTASPLLPAPIFGWPALPADLEPDNSGSPARTAR